MNSRTKTEEIPFLQQPGAGSLLATEAQARWADTMQRGDFDDEPTQPIRRVAIKEG